MAKDTTVEKKRKNVRHYLCPSRERQPSNPKRFFRFPPTNEGRTVQTICTVKEVTCETVAQEDG